MTGTEPAPSPRGTMDDHTLHLLSYPKPTSTTCVTRLRTLFRLYVKPVACTASEGLVDKLPPELIAHILIVGVLDAGDLARCAAVCRAFARTVRDPANDVALWKIACDRRWAQMALNPAECYRDELAGLSYKMRYRWAEADGQRRRGAVEDLLRVEVRRPPWATSVPRLTSPDLACSPPDLPAGVGRQVHSPCALPNRQLPVPLRAHAARQAVCVPQPDVWARAPLVPAGAGAACDIRAGRRYPRGQDGAPRRLGLGVAERAVGGLVRPALCGAALRPDDRPGVSPRPAGRASSREEPLKRRFATSYHAAAM